MNSAIVGAWESSWFCFPNTGLKRWNVRMDLLVNLLIKGVPGCCSRKRIGVETVGKSESVVLCELQQSPSSVVCLSNAEPSYCPSPVLVCVRA